MSKAPLIVHIIYRLAIGGLENGLVNLINRMPKDRYRHVIICADNFTDFKNRIQRNDVDVYALKKRPGNDLKAQYRLWKLLRELKPDIVHTRNLGTIEYTIPAFLAGVKYRVHGEHGRDMSDIDGANRKYIFLRKFYCLFITRFIALSKDLESYLVEAVGIDRRKVIQLYNGVDIARFKSKEYDKNGSKREVLRIGTVGRLQAEKDQATLIQAFNICLEVMTNKSGLDMRLSLIGDGPDRASLEDTVQKLGIQDSVDFLGARDDVPRQMSALDIFVLPSKGEGISNTILESMASGLPVIATAVGGNPELVVEGKSGYLVPSANPQLMAEAIGKYIDDPCLLQLHGKFGRERAEKTFSMKAMVDSYMKVYDDLIGEG